MVRHPGRRASSGQQPGSGRRGRSHVNSDVDEKSFQLRACCSRRRILRSRAGQAFKSTKHNEALVMGVGLGIWGYWGGSWR